MTEIRTLLSFLGTTDYQPTCYVWEGYGEHTSAHVTEALCALWKPHKVILLATHQAKDKHGDMLQNSLVRAECEPIWRMLPAGRGFEEQWQQFELLCRTFSESLQEDSAAQIVLDITHGFRSQPFMSGAALSVVQAALRQSRDIRIVYGEYQREAARNPIWDLSLFLELAEWAQALRLFLVTGVAAPIVDLTAAVQRRTSLEVHARGGRDFPKFNMLKKAITEFADDLSTVRVAAIITGYSQDPRGKHQVRGSARRLLDAIEQCRQEVNVRLPPLALILGELEIELQPLVAGHLAAPEGQQAIVALANYYLKLERYPEAAVVIREAAVNRHARDASAIEVNSVDYSDELRRKAEYSFSERDEHLGEIAGIRNDIEHGGFRRQPASGKSLKQRVSDLVQRQSGVLCEQKHPHLPSEKEHPTTYFISRHPGAIAWAAEEGIIVDRQLDHLDINLIRTGDTVIGSLPVNLAAEVCAKNAHYLHLSLELPKELRGKELTVVQMRACNARLEEFTVRPTVVVR